MCLTVLHCTACLHTPQDFFLHREHLVHVLLLVDASLPPQPVDADCARWLADCEVPFAICFTKCDADKRDGPSSARYVGQLN